MRTQYGRARGFFGQRLGLAHGDDGDIDAAAARRWRARLDGVAYPMLARWCRGALGARRMGTACVVYAHLALLFRNVRAAAFGRREVATLLTAQVFLNINYTFDAEPTVDAPRDDAAAAGGASAKGGGFFGAKRASSSSSSAGAGEAGSRGRNHA